MPRFTLPDREILAAALIGLQKQLSDVDGKIANLRSRIGRGGSSAAVASAANSNGRRPLSAAARRRIAAAQKRRWAAYRKAHR